MQKNKKLKIDEAFAFWKVPGKGWTFAIKKKRSLFVASTRYYATKWAAKKMAEALVWKSTIRVHSRKSRYGEELSMVVHKNQAGEIIATGEYSTPAKLKRDAKDLAGIYRRIKKPIITIERILMGIFVAVIIYTIWRVYQ